MAKIDARELAVMRETFTDRKIEAEDKMKELYKSAQDLYDSYAESIENYFDSEFSAHTVGRNIDGMDNQVDAIRMVHIAIAHSQEMSGLFRLRLYPQITHIYVTAKTLYDVFYTEFMNDDAVSDTLTTNADKVREAELCLLYVGEDYEKITTILDQVKSYGKFVDEQMFSLNRMHTMVMNLEKLRDNEMFGEAKISENKTIAKEEIEDLEDYEDLVEEAPVKKEVPKKKKLVAKKKKVDIEDLDDLDDIMN